MIKRQFIINWKDLELKINGRKNLLSSRDK